MSPDRLSINCRTARSFVRTAYVLDGGFNPTLDIPIEGGPAWLDSERYQIVAKADGTPGQETMLGPMLRALLEDRFKMKVHRETREVPVYALTVAKSGAKLQSAQEGMLRGFLSTLSKAAPPALESGQKTFCGLAHGHRAGPNVTLEVLGATVDEFSKAFGASWIGLDRIVINKAGIKGTFDFHMEFAPGEETPGFAASLEALALSSTRRVSGFSITDILRSLGRSVDLYRDPKAWVKARIRERASRIYRHRSRGEALRKLMVKASPG